MKISVVINYYNSEKFIQKAIQSVLDQTYQNFDLILYDNCSTDQSYFIVKNFKDSRLKYYKSNKHVILSRARGLALKECKNDWVAFLDSDDYWSQKKLEIQVEKIKADLENIGLVYTDYLIDVESKIKNPEYPSEAIDFAGLLNKNPIVFSSVLFSKSIAEQEGGFDPLLKYAEDHDLLLKISRKKKIIFIDKKLTYYKIHSNNLSKKYELRAFAESKYILKKYSEYKDTINAERNLNNNIKKFYFRKLFKLLLRANVCKMFIVFKKRLF
jgi:glycosyltransferase involved in cell wall biosynthesis